MLAKIYQIRLGKVDLPRNTYSLIMHTLGCVPTGMCYVGVDCIVNGNGNAELLDIQKVVAGNIAYACV